MLAIVVPAVHENCSRSHWCGQWDGIPDVRDRDVKTVEEWSNETLDGETSRGGDDTTSAV